MHLTPINNAEFNLFKSFIYNHAGITLSDSKKPLVTSRLAKRLKHHGLFNFKDYYDLISNTKHEDEQQIALNLLTTNETHFFREPKHFDFLKNNVLPKHPKNKPFRVWSAACSSGEEPYTIAMILNEGLKDTAWDVFGSDISTSVLNKAKLACYPISRAEEVPRPYLLKYCLKGTGESSGTMLIDRQLRQRVQYRKMNLLEPYPDTMGVFDIIFLRNVMIYFDIETKKSITKKMLPMLRTGGLLIISHSESLNGINSDFELVMPSIYQKP